MQHLELFPFCYFLIRSISEVFLSCVDSLQFFKEASFFNRQLRSLSQIPAILCF